MFKVGGGHYETVLKLLDHPSVRISDVDQSGRAITHITTVYSADSTYTVSQKSSPFLFLRHLCQISFDFANFGLEHRHRKFETNTNTQPITYISFHMFVPYLIKSGNDFYGIQQAYGVKLKVSI